MRDIIRCKRKVILLQERERIVPSSSERKLTQGKVKNIENSPTKSKQFKGEKRGKRPGSLNKPTYQREKKK